MNIFSNESILGRFLGKIGDIIILNLLFVICSIPIITIGISYTSMEYAFLKQLREPDAAAGKAFFHSFRRNFRQSTLAWLLILLLLFIFSVDINVFGPSGVMPFAPFYYLFILSGFVLGFTALYVFPVIAAFQNSLKNLFLQAFFMASKNIPFTLLMCAIVCFPIHLTFLDARYFLVYLTLWIVAGFGLIGYTNAFIFFRIFKPYLGEDEEENEPG